MSDWHGYSRNDINVGVERPRLALHIGRLPGRKQLCLYTEGSGQVDILAFFKTEALAQEAQDLLDHIIFGDEYPKEP